MESGFKTEARKWRQQGKTVLQEFCYKGGQRRGALAGNKEGSKEVVVVHVLWVFFFFKERNNDWKWQKKEQKNINPISSPRAVWVRKYVGWWALLNTLKTALPCMKEVLPCGPHLSRGTPPWA